MKYYSEGISQVLQGEFNPALQIVLQKTLDQEHFKIYLIEKLDKISKELQIPFELHEVYLECGFVGFMAEFTPLQNNLISALFDFPRRLTQEVKPLVHYLGYKVYCPIPSCLNQVSQAFSKKLENPGDPISEDWSEIGLHLSLKFVPTYPNQRAHHIKYRILSLEGDTYLLKHEVTYTSFAFKKSKKSIDIESP